MEAKDPEGSPTYVVVKPQQMRSGLIGSAWRFIAVDRAGRIAAASDAFEANGHALKDNKAARLALDALIVSLRHDGWIMDLTPKQQANAPWYAYGFRADGASPSRPEPPPVVEFAREPSAPSAPREGLSIQAMWAITLIVLVILFLICVVLAFSAQVEIRPAT